LEAIYDKNNYLSKGDRKMIEKAYFFAENAHKDQKRKSGEPYFVHLVSTAKNLAEIGMDGIVISAGILHDCVEDGVATQKKIKEVFGEEILFLINGVTKLGTIKYRGMRRHNESLRKLFVATSKDIRVLIIKFADRIHNLETLHHVKPEKQLRIATESLDIYAPLAYRLGITTLSKKLGDLAFPYVYPEEYKVIEKIIKERSGENIRNLEKASRSISKKLALSGIKNFKIKHRIKAVVSLHKKLKRKGNDPEKVFDLIAMRVIVPTVHDCYKALGVIHDNFKPMPGRIKDYIALPKSNGYNSIHTSIFTGHGGILEIQIRTSIMDTRAEFGAASHIGYKAKTTGAEGFSMGKEDWVGKFFNLFSFGKRAEEKEKID
jgi:guanosine-3',5'-bis(diphosphate) 3'-pyrophosphohydrolase